MSTPLLGPVVPDVYMMQKMSWGVGARPSHGALDRWSAQSRQRHWLGIAPGRSPNTISVLRCGSSSARLTMCSTSDASTTMVASWQSFNWWRRNVARSSVLSITAVPRSRPMPNTVVAVAQLFVMKTPTRSSG